MILTLAQIKDNDKKRIGGKCFSLYKLHQQGFQIPKTVCITTEAYNHYVDSTGLKENILLELNRKDFKDMRWEEIWDASLRVRNMFLKKPIPAVLENKLSDFFKLIFLKKNVVVRSSAPGEDSAKTSFAGLHESFVNVYGIDAILEHIRLVWASLWSDAALLYRKELGLNIEKSSMAVIVQELIQGEKSGVMFLGYKVY